LTGFTPFHVTFGHSPVLPIDIILGVPSTDKQTDVPKFVGDLHHSLNAVYTTIRTNLDSAHQRNKMRYDKNSTSAHCSIGDLLWLYNPAVKSG